MAMEYFLKVVLLKDIQELQSLIGDIPLPSDYSGTGISQKENSAVLRKKVCGGGGGGGAQLIPTNSTINSNRSPVGALVQHVSPNGTHRRRAAPYSRGSPLSLKTVKWPYSLEPALCREYQGGRAGESARAT
ncbi:unnamed protein product, partial [Nesidiocoris tenuis]